MDRVLKYPALNFSIDILWRSDALGEHFKDEYLIFYARQIALSNA